MRTAARLAIFLAPLASAACAPADPPETIAANQPANQPTTPTAAPGETFTAAPTPGARGASNAALAAHNLDRGPGIAVTGRPGFEAPDTGLGQHTSFGVSYDNPAENR